MDARIRACLQGCCRERGGTYEVSTAGLASLQRSFDDLIQSSDRKPRLPQKVSAALRGTNEWHEVKLAYLLVNSLGLPVSQQGLRNIVVSIESAAVVVDSDTADEQDPLPTHGGDAMETEDNVRLKRRISELEGIVADQACDIRRLNNHKLVLIQRRRNTSRQLREQVQQARMQSTEGWKRGAGRYFSIRGGCSLVVRTLASGCSARRIGLVLALDVHRTSVCTWEIWFNAALLAGSWTFYKCQEILMREALADGVAESGRQAKPWRYSQHLSRGDATNTLVWQKTKLHTLQVRSQYLTLGVRDDDDVSVVSLMQQVEEHLCMGDLLQVQTPSAEGTHALVKKQLKSTGMPYWSEQKPLDAEAPNVCEVFASCTDSGPDEDKAKTLSMYECAGAGLVTDANIHLILFIPLLCWFHQYHLMVKKSLLLADEICARAEPYMNQKRSYFSTLAKLLHVWRDNCKAIHHHWAGFDRRGAKQYTSKRPPQPIAGRWGKVDECERYVLAPPLHQLRIAFSHAGIHGHAKATAPAALCSAGSSSVASADKQPANPVETLMEFSVQEARQYSLKMSRWKGDAGSFVTDDVFIPIITKIMSIARQPLLHFYNWLMKVDTKGFCIDGELRFPGKLAQMVWWEADAVLEDRGEPRVGGMQVQRGDPSHPRHLFPRITALLVGNLLPHPTN